MFLLSALTLTAFLASAAIAADPCFYGETSFTIVTKLSGLESGEITEHVMDCGRKRVEIRDTSMTVGGRATGKTGNYAGIDCDFWDIPALQTQSCVTSWGATLYTQAALMNMASEREATSIKIGDPGPASAYAYDASAAQQQPDVAEFMKLFQQGK
jgi:hypothetical protein